MPALDGTDLKILDLLQNDASHSLSEIADRVHLSQNACWRRIKRLEEEGVIVKRVALLDPEKLGVGVTVFVSVRAGEHSEKWLETFASEVRKMPEVVEFYRMTGDVDYLLKLQVANIDSMTREERRHPDILKASRKKRIAAGAGQTVEQVNKLLKMHRNMADMMKAMSSGKRGPLAGIAQAMGFGGGMQAPTPEQLKAMSEKMQGGGVPGGLPNLPKDLPPGLRSGLPNLPGLTGLSNKPTLPGLGGPGPGKKK